MTSPEPANILDVVRYGNVVLHLKPLTLSQTCSILASHAATIIPSILKIQASQLLGDAHHTSKTLLEAIGDNEELIVDLILHSAQRTPADRPTVAALPTYILANAIIAVARISWGLDMGLFLNSFSPNSNVAFVSSPAARTTR